jgi:hypothetical protein
VKELLLTYSENSKVPHRRRARPFNGADGILQDHGAAADVEAAEFYQVRSCWYVLMRNRAFLFEVLLEVNWRKMKD